MSGTVNSSTQFPCAHSKKEKPVSDGSNTKPKSRRGFAAMSPEKRREIAKKGGKSVPREKRTFAKDRDLASSAGRKGGESSRGGGRPPTRYADDLE